MKIGMRDRLTRALAARGVVRPLIVAAAVALGAVACDVHSPTGVGSLVRITVAPDASIPINTAHQFVAVGWDAEGREVEISPEWSVVAGGGVIDQSGVFTSGSVPGVFTATVKATDDGQTGTATVTVTVGPLASIEVTPNPHTLAVNATQQYTAVGKDAAGNVVTITPTWSMAAGGGVIDASGLFTAGTAAGTFTNAIKATSGAISGTATVNVLSGPLASMVVVPDPATLETGSVQMFTAVGRDASGNSVAVAPVWLVVAGGGSITQGGLFTAGSAAGTYANTVKAVSEGVSAFATVIVTSPPPPTPPTPGPGTVVSIEVTPNPANIGVNSTQQFTAVGRDGSGNLVSISPTWAVVANGGSINGSGLFTSGASTGTFTNTVRATASGVSGFATVIVSTTPPPPTPPGSVATITVTPNPATMGVNETQQFTAVGRDGSGTIVAITPTWAVVANGGSIGSAGLFTAGGSAGTFNNTVRASSGGVSGFATVIVTAVVPPPLPPVSPINLGSAATHGILAGSTITCVTLGTVNADASVWPGSAITGFPPCVITGARHAADAVAQTAQSDLTTAYNQLDGMPCGAAITSNLGGQTLQPGVHCSTSSVGLTGEMFFDGLGDSNAIFVIKAASTLTTAAASVTLLNGAQAKNIYWLVGSSATLGVGSAMKGNIITFTSITLVDNSTLIGRALARNGAVTLGTGNTITLP